MRLALYAGCSTAAAAACLLKAFQRPNFYSATVYLSQSNACLLILTNLLLVGACSFMFALQRLLYGPLRPIEIEQLSEKAWYAVLDTLLAMPSFREDVGGWLLAMFTLLLAGKVWGWIGEGRVDVLEQQPPANPRLFHIRLATSLVASVLFDLWMLDYCVETVMSDPRPGMMVIFTFEFAILTVFSTFTLSRYFLALIQTRIEKAQMEKAVVEKKAEIRAERAAARQNETSEGTPAPASPPSEEPIEVDENELDVPGWEEKRRYLFALEVFTDFIKLLIYIVFFTVSITFNGLPMHIMRDVYMTFASFSKRVADYVAYRKATSDMNARYPDATTEEIRGDACIVCREIMVAWEQPAQAQQQGQVQPAAQQPAAAPPPARRRDEGLRAKKLPCGHILHLRCLKSWLERQQVCPTCRRPVVVATETAPRGQGAGAAGRGAPGQQPARRPGRARIFNFGPVRVGFLNGPGDQIGNIVRQMQNGGQQNAQAPGAGGQDGAGQQGPNHLGLQVPYANGQQGAQTGGPRANLPTSVQLLQIQQQIFQTQARIMQEAQSLRLEQSQLATLQRMDDELAQLRRLQQWNQQPFGSRGPPPTTGQTNQTSQMSGLQQYQQATETLQGAGSAQYANGHDHLPQGMTLPEGWTVMPLHRADGSATGMQPAVATSSTVPDGSQAAPAAADGESATATSQPATENAAGPTDERGSPLFVPTDSAASSGQTTATSAAPPSTAPAVPPSDTPSASSQTSAQPQAPLRSEHPTPWGQEGWSFDNQANGQTNTNGEQTSSAAANENANGAPIASAPEPRPEQQGHSYEGKGKAKAAQVEDAPDERQ
ncbi:E3 ubiquitin-protein ligase hrd1 [Saxophila tyrrhenica]|uniref:RING-type E3 ubiquitin transferase n=1 Tax=Saxophila tyrrhenica TaxID=1690608 RepID=A0AAV9PLB1_9PEZI|nr:E3 ubiquitin-protein ligase hrd1 [Saxophila tyrrhenica]